MAPSSSMYLYSSGGLLRSRPASTARLVGRCVRPACSLSMNGCAAGAGDRSAVSIGETRALPAVSAPEEAVGQLRAAVSALCTDPAASSSSGIIRFEVPIRQRGDAIEWLQAQSQLQSSLPRCFFSGRGPLPDTPALTVGGSNNGNDSDEERPVSVAGVGSAVFFRGTDPFSHNDWRAIKRFLPRDCPLIRAYGAIRFDASRVASVEWEDYGAFYFIIPQVEFSELEDSSVLATTIAWDESLSRTWQSSVDQLQSTLHKVSPCSVKMNKSTLPTAIKNLDHVPNKASWDLAVTEALQMMKGTQRELVKVVLARCSRYITDTCIDPLELLACLKVDGPSTYQFCIQPPDAPAFVGNSPEKLFHRKYLNISSEALAGTRSRGETMLDDFQIGQDLLHSIKENTEFTIVRESIKNKLEMICDEVVVNPSKALRKLPSVQHLSAQLAGRLRSEDGEFEVLNSLHPTPALCGLPTDQARKFIRDYEMFDRGMYAGPVGWFGGAESQFAVGIRSALLGKGYGTFVYAGAGIIEGTHPSFEWNEVNLKASQFAKLIAYQEHHICYQAVGNMGTFL